MIAHFTLFIAPFIKELEECGKSALIGMKYSCFLLGKH